MNNKKKVISSKFNGNNIIIEGFAIRTFLKEICKKTIIFEDEVDKFKKKGINIDCKNKVYIKNICIGYIID